MLWSEQCPKCGRKLHSQTACKERVKQVALPKWTESSTWVRSAAAGGLITEWFSGIAVGRKGMPSIRLTVNPRTEKIEVFYVAITDESAGEREYSGASATAARRVVERLKSQVLIQATLASARRNAVKCDEIRDSLLKAADAPGLNQALRALAEARTKADKLAEEIRALCAYAQVNEKAT